MSGPAAELSPKVSLFRNVYDPKVVHAPDIQTAFTIGERLVRALGAHPAPSALITPENVDLTREKLSFSYTKRSIPGYFDTENHIVALDMVGLEGGVALYADIKTHSAGKVLAAEQALGEPIQALDRNLGFKFGPPEQTVRAARDTLQLPGVEMALTEAARRGTFAALLNRILFVGERLERPNTDMITFLKQNFSPRVAGEIALLRARARAGQMNDAQLGHGLKDIAILHFAGLQNPEEHKHLITAAAETLRLQYVSANPEWAGTPNYPHTFMFGSAESEYPMGTTRLYAPVPWVGNVVDPRVSVSATVEVDGTYDLRDHVFTTAERDKGASGIGFVVARHTIAPAHTEREIGEMLDEQVRAIGGQYLTDEQMRTYVAATRNATPEPLPLLPPVAPAPDTIAFRHPVKPPYPKGFHYR